MSIHEDQSATGRAVTRATSFTARRERAMRERARRLARMRDAHEDAKRRGLNRDLNLWG
jgi:hypothetical protein